jgi:hypothetical protein
MCPYTIVTNTLNRIGGVQYDVAKVKTPVMTAFYASKAQPSKVFGKGEVLNAFWTTVKAELPGPNYIMDIMLKAWNKTAFNHSWTLPDRHKSFVPVVTVAEKRLEIDELDHLRFTYRTKVNKPTRSSRSLPANIRFAKWM